MVKKGHIVGIVIASVVVLAIAAFLVIEFGFKKWRCTENGCERIITSNGYSSKGECEQSCGLSKSYNLTNLRNCVEAEGDSGTYASLGACQQVAGAQSSAVYVPYPVYSYRPRYWGPRRRWWGHKKWKKKP